MELNDLLLRGGLTLALGLIIGFQRERKETTLAGIRTFPLFALSGFFCGLMEAQGIDWVVASGLICVTAVVVFGMFTQFRQSGKNHGLTTEAAIIVMYLLGAGFATLVRIDLLVVAGGICAILLHLKDRMHRLVDAFNMTEVQAIMQFVLLAFVVLPILPNRTFDNYEVLNPRKIWLMVVLITGISLVSYLVQKLRQSREGTLWTGVLGGLISSTAATVTLSRISARLPEMKALVPAIIISSTVAFVRVLSEIVIVSPLTFARVIVPLSGLFLFMVILSFITYQKAKGDQALHHPPEDGTPSELKAALIFGGLFAVILYSSAWARHEFGDAGLYVISFISGLIDVDAITPSTSALVQSGKLHVEVGWKLIMLAFVSNLVFKGILVAFIARGSVRKLVCIHLFLSAIVGGAVILFG